MIELNKIYNEDCLEGMKRIPDGSVDCVICDLPYGTTKNSWDTVIPLEGLWGGVPKNSKAVRCNSSFLTNAFYSHSCM